MDSTTTTIMLALSLSALLYCVSAYSTSSRGPLPPGPKGIPWFGNLFQLPKQRPWVKMEEWSREFGPIYTLRLGFTTVIVLGTAPVALELLDKRSSIYSSRPRMIMTSELVSKGLRMTFMPYGDLWRKERKLLHQLTSPKAAASYEGIQSMESAQLVKDMIETPEAFWPHAMR